MNETLLHETIAALTRSEVKLFVATTGAGAGLQEMLWRVPGCSTYFVGSAFTYAREETRRLLGFDPEKYVTKETAVDMAMAAYMRAYTAVDVGQMPMGLAMTASVATSEMHRGDHRVCMAVMTPNRCYTATVLLPKRQGMLARVDDGVLTDCMAATLIQHALGTVPAAFYRGTSLGFSGDIETDGASGLRIRPIEMPAEQLERLFFRLPVFHRDGRRTSKLVDGERILFPGAFDPVHEGHVGITHALHDQIVTGEITWTIEAKTVHKEATSVQTLLQRASRIFQNDYPVQTLLFTNGLPLFVDKARHFPGAGFVVGADTLQRMLDPKWGPSAHDVISEFVERDSFLYVVDRDGVTLDTIVDSLPQPDGLLLGRISLNIEGDWKISSSELRRQANAK